MPNWSTNNLIISGKKNDVKKVFSVLDGYKDDMTLDEFRQFIWGHQKDLTMRSWFPMPQTFVDYDTTNGMYHRDDKKTVVVNEETGELKIEPRFNSDEEYDAYCDGYHKAVKYQKREYGMVGWYQYNCATLGTKWDAELQDCGPADIDEQDDFLKIQFTFDTAWSAPMPWFNDMIDKYPDLNWTLSAEEETNEFNFVEQYDGTTKERRREDFECEDEEWDDEECEKQ